MVRLPKQESGHPSLRMLRSLLKGWGVCVDCQRSMSQQQSETTCVPCWNETERVVVCQCDWSKRRELRCIRHQAHCVADATDGAGDSVLAFSSLALIRKIRCAAPARVYAPQSCASKSQAGSVD